MGGAPPPADLPANAILVRNKIDLTPTTKSPHGAIAISVHDGTGLAQLTEILADRARALTAAQAGPPLTRARHRAAIEESASHLAAALDMHWPEMRGEDMRLAMRALGRLTGAVGVEDLLDTVFGQFCIGK